MANINIDFDKITGKIKPMHAVGQPPFKGGGFGKGHDFSPIQILKDANIPYSRLHDVGGAFGSNRFVDIPNIFRDFEADVDDPASYDFAFTDTLIKGLADYGVAPYFRLGVTIENQCVVRAYRIHPPKDYDKWAKICEHIIRHYNEGWADGFNYGIKYWEIWNEPDNREFPDMNQMWTGTPEEYYRLYDVTAKHLKACFGDKIKVGGYACTGVYGIFGNPEKYGLEIERREEKRYNSPREDYRMNFLYGFLDYIKEHNSPIDFFSWHVYSTVDTAEKMADFIDKVLTNYGLGHIETHLNEWNNSHDRLQNRDCSYASAQTAAMMCGMQNKKTSMLMYYDAKYVALGPYAGFYDVKTYEPSNVYYTFKAFGELYKLGNQTELNCDTNGLYAVSAASDTEKAVLITNTTGSDQVIETNLEGEFEAYLIDIDHLMTNEEINPKKFTLKENQVILLKRGIK
ncbi:MAG: hypothetical protein IJX50_00030 [Clostridia bacterium]|nr:hypothetical protein [Clostridia bacterium]